MPDIELDDTMKVEVYEFLNNLRESGQTNMFGATSYIQEEFGFEEKESRAWLKQWMDDF